MATVSVDEPPAVTEAGAKDAVAPVGSPEADSATDWADPEVTAVPMVDVADAPAVAEAEPGVAESEKSLLTGTPPLVFSAVSSSTKLVVPPLASVSAPENFSVTVCPA
ncbi:hypothetical protein ACFQ9X_07315 [Catenulispora yoronensis]